MGKSSYDQPFRFNQQINYDSPALIDIAEMLVEVKGLHDGMTVNLYIFCLERKLAELKSQGPEVAVYNNENDIDIELFVLDRLKKAREVFSFNPIAVLEIIIVNGQAFSEWMNADLVLEFKK